MSDKATNGLDSLLNINLGNLVRYLYLPKQISVYGKRFSINRSQFSDSIMENRLSVIQSPKTITKSFIFDLTPYVGFLFGRFNALKYAKEAMMFINNSINALKSEIQPGIIDNWLLLYILDDRYFQNYSRLVDRELYGYTILKSLQLNNKNINALGPNIDSIFLAHIGIKLQISKIYDKNVPSDYSRVRNIIMKIKPNLQIEESEDNSSENNIVIDKTKEEEKNTDQNTNIKKPEEQLAPGENDISKEELENNFKEQQALKNDANIIKDNEEESTFKNLFKNISRDTKQYSLDNSSIPNNSSNVIISKIDDSQFDDDRKIPLADEEDQETADQIINKDNEKMFPFLNHTKKKDSNISDVNKANVKEDNEGKILDLLDKLVPQLTNTKEQERKIHNILFNKFTRDPDLFNKVFKAFEEKDMHQLLVYINNDHLPYMSKIYPKKDEVDREVIGELDNWSEEHGYIDAVGSDSVLNEKLISGLVNSNMHRVMAQKQLTWNNMPKEVEGYITKLLENNGFQLISVEMVDKKPPITEIEPTYKSEIRIKIRNKATKTGQTLVFEVPTLLEGKYHISGGIKWLFPNVIATLPIFVVKPGRVQFRSSYSAMTFQHHVTSKADTVSVFVSGINMPLLIWLLQLESFDSISKELGFTYKLYKEKKEAKSDTFVLQFMADEKTTLYLGINITNNDNAKLIKSIAINLQALFNKLKKYGIIFDLYSYDKDSEYIQLFNAKKRNISYAFDQIKKYMIDKRTEGILIARGIEPDLFKVTLKCASICINDVAEDRLGINNTNLRLMDLVPSEIEKALHYAISEYKRRRLMDPDAKLVVNSGWITNELRKQSVLLIYKDSNITIENSQLTGARIVGPGGFGSVDMVQIPDRNLIPDHFGTIDPVDTAEGNPGIQLTLTTGFEYDPKNKIFSQVRSNNSYKNIFGTASGQVPFVACDDGNRVQFGGSQGKQVVPIEGSESPLIGTGMEAYLPNYSSSKFSKRSPVDGRVVYIDDKVIIIRDNRNKNYSVNIMPSDLQTSAGKYNGLEHTPTVKVGDIVKKNQHLVKNQFIKPTYSAGSNVLACYKPESGYTYDDGIVISESFAKRFTSLHYQIIDIRLTHISELIEFPLFKFKQTGNMNYEAGDTIVKIKKIAFGGFSENEVIASVKCKVVDIQVFPADKSFDGLIKDIENTLYSKTNNALKMSGLDPMMSSNELIANAGKFEFRKEKLESTLIRIKLIEYRSIGLGDKLTNRHGAKGVVSQIMPDDMMPVIPDGRHVDVCLSPLGVISRMNMGQLLELHIGNVLDSGRKFLRKNQQNTDLCITTLNKLFELLDGYSDKRLSNQMNSYINSLDKIGQQKLIQEYIDNGIRMIFPPFETPTMNSVKEAAKLVGAELEARLYLPKYGRKTISPVTYGILYMLKLEHISSVKQNTRSIGKYIQTTGQPAKPGSHSNAIRIGEQDSWAYLAYPHGGEVLKEMFIVNGDSLGVKEKVIRDIINTGKGDIDKNDLQFSGSKNLFNIYCTVAGLEIK